MEIKSLNLKFVDLTAEPPSILCVLLMDNTDGAAETYIVYDLAIYNNTVYRMQKKATYFGTDVTWSTYNYQPSAIRPFVDTITLDVYPAILPSNGINVAKITAIIKDQYSEPIQFQPVAYTDDDDIGFITISPVETWIDGVSTTFYKAGVIPATVTIEGIVTHHD
jgi:hypothetical protein